MALHAVKRVLMPLTQEADKRLLEDAMLASEQEMIEKVSMSKYTNALSAVQHDS